MTLNEIREAYRYNVEHQYIPWGNRILLGLGFSALMVAAGWGHTPWWGILIATIPWPGLALFGIWDEIREHRARSQKVESA